MCIAILNKFIGHTLQITFEVYFEPTFSYLYTSLLIFCVLSSLQRDIYQTVYRETRANLNNIHAQNMDNKQKLPDYKITEIWSTIEQENGVLQTMFTNISKTYANLKSKWIIRWVGTFMQLSVNGILLYQ